MWLKFDELIRYTLYSIKRDFLVINRKNKNSRKTKKTKNDFMITITLRNIWLNYLFISHRSTSDF